MSRLLVSTLVCALLVLGPLLHITHAQEAPAEEVAETEAPAPAETDPEAEVTEEDIAAAAAAAGVEERGIRRDIGNCVAKATRIPPNLNAAKSCLEGLVNNAKKPLNTQISNLTKDVKRAKDGVTTAVNNATRPLNSQISTLNTNLRNANTELNRVKGGIQGQINAAKAPLNTQITRLNRDLANAQKGVQSQINAAKAPLNSQISRLNRDLANAQKGVQSQITAATGPLNSQIAQLKRDLENAGKNAQSQAGEVMARLQSESALLAAATQLNLEPLVQCLASSPADLGRLITEFGNDPTAFAKSEMEALIRITNQHVTKMMGPQINGLSNARPTQDVNRLIDQADRMLAQLAAQRPASKCVYEAIGPMRQQAKTTAKSLLPTIQKQIDHVVEKQIKPAVSSAIMAQLTPIMIQIVGTDVPLKPRPKRIAKPQRKKGQAQQQKARAQGEQKRARSKAKRGKPSVDDLRRKQQALQKRMRDMKKKIAARKRVDRSRPKVKRKVKRTLRTRGVDAQVEEEILVYPDEPSEELYRSLGLMPPIRIAERSEEEEEEPIPWIEIDEPVLERSAEPDPVWVTERGLTDILPSKDELQMIARGVAVKHLLNPDHINGIADEMTNLARSIPDPAGRQEAANAVLEALGPAEEWPEFILLEIGVEVLRHVGHKYINSSDPGGGDFLLSSGLAILNELETTVMNLVEGLCGLIPEVGGIIAGVVIEIIDTVYELGMIPASKPAISKAMHTGFDWALDAAHETMKDEHDPARFRERAGPMGELLEQFPTRAALIAMAGDHVREEQESLHAYHASVREVATAVAEEAAN